jgi:hypothetical protein
MKKNHFLLFLILNSFLIYPLYGQNFLEILNETPPNLSTDVEAEYSKCLSIPLSHSHKIVKFGKIEDFQINGIINLKIPQIEKIARFKASRVEYLTPNEYVWVGDRTESDSLNYPDYIILSMSNGLLGGEISYEGEFYRILPVSNEYQVIFKILDEGIENCVTTTQEPNEGASAPCTMNGDECRINVLITYTNGVKLAYPNMFPIGRMLIEQVNTALRRSNVKHRYKLVNVVPLIDFWVDLDTEAELFQLEDLLSTNTFIADERNNSNADIVVLLSLGENYTLGAGIANVIPSTLSEGCAVVALSYALGPRLTFTHELGHTFGAQHDNDPCCLPARAHKFYSPLTGKSYKTVLHLVETSEQRILNYSNPDVSYIGAATGETERNNACVMQNNGCIVSGLMPPTECFFFVNGNFDSECRSENLAVSVISGDNFPQICDPADLYYRFEYSLDGINFIDDCLTFDPFCEINFTPPLYSQTVFVRVTISNSTGIVATTFDWFKSKCPYVPVVSDPPQPKPGGNTAANLQPKVSHTKVYPTIALDDITIKYDDSDQIEHIRVYDLFNREVNLDLPLNFGDGISKISLMPCSSGIYFVQIVGKNIRETHKVIKL